MREFWIINNDKSGHWYLQNPLEDTSLTSHFREVSPERELAIEKMLEALDKAIQYNAEGINGLVRGFIGNAEDDWRNSQKTLREAIEAWRKANET